MDTCKAAWAQHIWSRELWWQRPWQGFTGGASIFRELSNVDKLKNTLCWSGALELGVIVYWPVFFLALNLNSVPGPRCEILME